MKKFKGNPFSEVDPFERRGAEDRPTLLVTQYGVVKDDDVLAPLDEQVFLKWVKEYKIGHPEKVFETDKEWVQFYKRTIAEEYATRYFGLSERISD